jgi:hypothetical protein
MAGPNDRPFNREAADRRAVAPATRAAAYTAGDELPAEGCQIFVGTAGHIKGVPWANESATAILFKNIPAGTRFPVRFKSVSSAGAGTTAADLVAVW